MRNRNLVLVTLLLLFTNGLKLVNADVPNVLELNIEENGGQTLVISIRHGSPSSSHFVDEVQVELDGELVEVTDLDPQTETQFTQEYKLDSGAENIRVRVNCNLHGWSNWESLQMDEPTEPQGIPGFPVSSIILGLFLIIGIYLVKK